jgi:pseudouridylate synthase
MGVLDTAERGTGRSSVPIHRVSAEVGRALERGSGVVALESTVLAHGLPRPRNLEVGRRLEALVREAGATPATIAVLDGEPHIGLSEEELNRIASELDVLKLSTRDLALAAAGRRTGATTVAATSFLARSAGVQVFATGGIGGVHRGAPLDVSADLTELQRTDIIVVCAGAKSILDLPATREMLETLGVLVLGWGTESFPAFYTRDSGESVDQRVDSAAEVAEIWRAKQRLGAPGAVLVCSPVPVEHALDETLISSAIEQALELAARSGIRGKETTPFLLNHLVEATGGVSLEANIALLENNVRVAAQIAVELGAKG